MATYIAHIEDLRRGHFICIYSLPSPQIEQTINHAFLGPITVKVRTDPAVPVGYPLQVSAVSYPFVTCFPLQSNGTFSGTPLLLDTREMTLARLPARFIRSMLSEVPSRSPRPRPSSHAPSITGPSISSIFTSLARGDDPSPPVPLPYHLHPLPSPRARQVRRHAHRLAPRNALPLP